MPINSQDYRDAKALESELAAFMQDIIRIPSLSSSEGAVIERIREEMLQVGFDEATIDPMGNLIGRIGSGPLVIAFDGHSDTVDTGDLSLWDLKTFVQENFSRFATRIFKSVVANAWP